MTPADLLAASRAAREVALAADTLAVHLKRLADSAPPPAPLLPAQLATPQPIEASAPASAHQASEAPSGGAELSLPSGWREDRRGRVWMAACFAHSSEASVWQAIGDVDWRWAPDDEHQRGYAPTMLQAMCAALGIELRHGAWRYRWFAAIGDVALVDYLDAREDKDEVARAALERFHARQQPAPAPSLPECVCVWRDDEIESVSRYCPVHASEWRTIAEQRRETLEGSPELQASERGLR